jgi:23S rRNA G2445 N2-methylase RlmL
VAIHKDEVTLSLDTSGSGLNKRGYRKGIGPAPLRETLAAGMVLLSYWNRDRPFHDPFCGSGTIAIEAAMIGRNIAPGLNREFAAERWPRLPAAAWGAAREEAKSLILPEGFERPFIASDIDRRALGLARQHAELAGVAKDIHIQQLDATEISTSRKYGCIITNPPYGERMGEDRDIEGLYRKFGRAIGDWDTWSTYVLTTHPGLERLWNRSATRRRKLFNAQLPCTYYQFVGPRPPSREQGERDGDDVETVM